MQRLGSRPVLWTQEYSGLVPDHKRGNTPAQGALICDAVRTLLEMIYQYRVSNPGSETRDKRCLLLLAITCILTSLHKRPPNDDLQGSLPDLLFARF